MLLRGGQGKAGQARLLTDWARLGCRDAGGGDHGERGGAAGARSGSVCARRGSPSARGLPRTRAAGRGVGTPAAGDRPTAPDATMATDITPEAIGFLSAVGVFVVLLAVLALFINKKLCFETLRGHPHLEQRGKRKQSLRDKTGGHPGLAENC